MCKYRDYSISLKAVTAIPAFINFIVSKPMALPYVIWAGHLHGLDHGIILVITRNINGLFWNKVALGVKRV